MASSTPPLFTIPIPKCDDHPGGAVVATEPAPNVYLLTFTSPPDNRLTTAFCRAMLAALDAVEFGYPPGVVITTSDIPKFYSNGLDLDHAQETEGFCSDSLFAMWRRFLTYPMPTLALLNGHAFAGGIMTAMHHDYRIFNPSRGFACLNELDFGAPLKPAMSAIFRTKCTPAAYRTLVLEARRLAGPAALEAGVVDGLGGLPEALAFVEARGLAGKGKTGIYGFMKAEMYRDCVAMLSREGFEREERRIAAMVEEEDRRKEKGQEAAERLKAEGKAKL